MKIVNEYTYVNQCLNWYFKNFKKPHEKMLGRRYKRKYKNWYKNLKSKLECEFCDFKGSECVSALEFHHFGEDKINRISNMGGGLKNRLIILEEMSKCNVACANCHRKIHEDILTEKDKDSIKRNNNLDIIRKEYGRIKYKK